MKHNYFLSFWQFLLESRQTSQPLDDDAAMANIPCQHDCI